jgi:hypothetical protein
VVKLDIITCNRGFSLSPGDERRQGRCEDEGEGGKETMNEIEIVFLYYFSSWICPPPPFFAPRDIFAPPVQYIWDGKKWINGEPNNTKRNQPIQ